MARIYTVYTINRERSTSVGRSTLLMPGVVDGSQPLLSWADIQAIESQLLAIKRQDDPSVRNLFLTFWQWLAPGPAPLPQHRERQGDNVAGQERQGDEGH